MSNFEKLEKVADVIRGVTFGAKDAVTKPLVSYVPILRAGNIQERLYTDSDLVWVPQVKVNNEQYVKSNDIIMCTSSGSADLVGKIARAKNDWSGSFGAFCIGIRAKREIIDSSYLFHYLNSPIFKNWTKKSSGANIKNIRKSELESFLIPVPPFPEQKRIAAILDKADAIRRKRTETINLLNEFQKSLFLDMFGDPVRNDKKWPIISFGEVAEEMRYGTSEKCDDSNGESKFPVLRIPNIINKTISQIDLKYAHLDKNEVNKLLLREGDLLFVRTNGNPDYIGRCAVFELDSNYLYASYLIRVRVNFKHFRPRFLRENFSFPTYRQKFISETKTTAGNYNISTEGLRRLNLINPPLELQDKYLDISEKIEKFILDHQENLEIDDSLFQSLTQRAFKGEL